MTSAAQWDALDHYVQGLREQLTLYAWRIIVEHEPPEGQENHPDAALIDAQTVLTREGWTARIRFAENWTKQEPEAVRHVVIHELLHLPTDWPTSDLLDQIEVLCSPQTFALLNMTAIKNYERMVDLLAGMIADKYDLPTWPATDEGSS